MAAKKGKTKTGKVKELKSKRLNAKQADQVKGGLLPAVNLQHEGIKNVAQTSWKLTSPVAPTAYKW